MTVGGLPLALWAAVIQGRERQSRIISSATRRESVSFHLPLKSLTSLTSMRLTSVPQAASRGIRAKHHKSFLFISNLGAARVSASPLRPPNRQRLFRRLL